MLKECFPECWECETTDSDSSSPPLHGVMAPQSRNPLTSVVVCRHAKRLFIEDFCLPLQNACLITDGSIPGPCPTPGTGNDAMLGAVTLTGTWRGCLSIALREIAILLTPLASSVVLVIKAEEEGEGEEALNDTNALIIAPL
ncbi:uncharacterized [Tachysurus ichikawai]